MTGGASVAMVDGEIMSSLSRKRHQYVLAFLDGDIAGANHLKDFEGLQILDDGLDHLVLGDKLQNQSLAVRGIRHLASVLVNQFFKIWFRLFRWTHLRQQQFAANAFLAGDIDHLEHVNQAIELFEDLLNDQRIAVSDDRHPADLGIGRRRNRKRVDVEAATGEHAGDAGQHAEFVFDQYRDGMSFFEIAGHHKIWIHAKTMSLTAPPAGTMG